jgi:hypothetical protein
MTDQTRLEKLREILGALLIALYVVATFAAVFWTIHSRTLADIQSYTLRIGVWVALVSIVLGIVVASVKNEGGDDNWWRRGANWFYILLIAIIFSIVAGLTYYAIAVGIKDTYLWIASLPFTRDAAISVLTGATLALGVALFLLRLYLRSLYGLTEVVAGVFISTIKISEKTPAELGTAGSSMMAILASDDLYLVVLTAGVYLVVRGLDNVHQGIVRDPRDPVATKVVEWLNSPGQAKAIAKPAPGAHLP